MTIGIEIMNCKETEELKALWDKYKQHQNNPNFYYSVKQRYNEIKQFKLKPAGVRTEQ